MIERSNWTKADYVRLALWYIPAAVLTWGIHEVAHWGTGELLGYQMWISFNQAGLIEGSYQSTFHEVLVGMAGPMVTWVQGVVALILIRRHAQLRIYSFLFLAFFMRLVAMVLSFTSQPNDEAGTALLLGLPMWLLPSLSVALLLALTYSGSKHLCVGWRGNVLSYFMASIVTTIVVVLNSLVF